MWRTQIMGENKNKQTDLCTSDRAVTIKSCTSVTSIATTPAIAHMIMTPKPRAADYNPAASSPKHTPAKTPKQDPSLNHLQRDLNSPSAALRMRAMRALKSPTRAIYNNFDVPHAEISIITAEERNPPPPPTLPDILKDVIVYVEVRTGNDNRSEGVKTIIAKLGAQVNDRLLRNTTHVVFKDGLLSTYKRAQSWNIPIVSILWIEACKVQRRLCDPQQFPISNIHMYEYPELYGKLSRVRCMQPDSELNKRPRKRQGTPTGTKDKENDAQKRSALTQTTTPKNDITRFFRPLSQTKHLAEGESTESPATKLLNRMTNGSFTPLKMPIPADTSVPQMDKTNEVDLDRIGDSEIEKPTAQKSLDFGEGKRATMRRSNSLTVQPTKASTPLRASRRRSLACGATTAELDAHKVQSEPRVTRRRSSLMNMSQKSSIEEENGPAPIAEPEPRMTRRRSSLQLAAPPIAGSMSEPPVQPEQSIVRRRSVSTMEPSTPKLLKKPTFQAIAEEPLVESATNSSMDMSTPVAQAKTATIFNKTNYVQQTMEMCMSRAVIIGKSTERRTLYTTDHMEISEVNDENRNPYLKQSMENVTTQTSLDSFGEHTPVPVFSSTRLPGSGGGSSVNRRRSLFNVDLELIHERINTINTTSQRRSLALANEAELGECRTVAPLQAVALDAINKEPKLTEPKMRRLYTPNEDIAVVPSSSSSFSSGKSRQSSSGNSIASTDTVKRRRTLGVGVLKPTAAVGPTLQKSDPANEEFMTPCGSETTIDSASESHGDCVRSAKKRRTVFTMVHTNMHRDQVQVIHKAIRKLRGMRLDPTVTKRTTHLVSLEPRRTLNLLRGLMRGVWIVSYKWILESMRVGKWVNEEKYELTTFSRAVEICRTERQAFGLSYRCELFRYMEIFYVSSLCRPITFNNIKELLLLGGAKLTENRYKAKFIVGDKRRAEDDRIYLSPLWVLDSISAMQVQKFGKYLMKCAIVTPYGIRYEDPCQEQEEKPRRHLKVCYKDPALVINK
ncbi:microcephalin isoform X2 [Drosophila montana]|uniref:microcephalin isoform X2 n=1 Tax=Drosophila montana TaxID=40370 RepID=UPI00313BE230